MVQINGTVRNELTNKKQSTNESGMVIGLSSCSLIVDKLSKILIDKGFEFYSICAEYDRLLKELPTEDEPVLLSSVDMQAFNSATFLLIKEKINTVVGEVVYLMIDLSSDTSISLVIELAKISKTQGKIVVAIIAIPANRHDVECLREAKNALAILRPFVDTSFVFYKDTLNEDTADKNVFPTLNDDIAFSMPLDAIYRIAYQQGEIVVDESDVKYLLKSGAFAAVGNGQSNLPNRISIMFEQVLDSRYLKFLNKEKCTLILLSIEASVQNAIRFDEIEELDNLLHQHFGEEVDIIMGLKNDNALGDTAKVVCLFSFSEHALLSNI